MLLFSQVGLTDGASIIRDKKEQQSNDTRIIVLKYLDFGPQVFSYTLIGFERYQWDCSGCGTPDQHDDIKVVVYRNIELSEVKIRYPVIERVSDYRYVEYNNALTFLENTINFLDDEQFKKLKSDLLNTYQRIKEELPQ